MVKKFINYIKRSLNALDDNFGLSPTRTDYFSLDQDSQIKMKDFFYEVSIEGFKKNPFLYYKYIPEVILSNPLTDQAIRKNVRSANSGHNLIIDTGRRRGESYYAGIKQSLSEMAKTSTENDSTFAWIDSIFRELITYGSVSRYILPGKSGILKQIQYLPEFIYYKKIGYDYFPYLKIKEKLVPLDTKYFLRQSIEKLPGSPYSIPPLLSAIPEIAFNSRLDSSMVKVLDKISMLGMFVLRNIRSQRRPNERESDYQTRLNREYTEMVTSLKKNIGQGILYFERDPEVNSDNQKPIDNYINAEHSNIASDSRGVIDFYKYRNEKMLSSIDMPKFLMGQVDFSANRALAEVLDRVYGESLSSYQQVTGDFISKTYITHLLLSNIPVYNISLVWNERNRFGEKVRYEGEKLKQDIWMQRYNTFKEDGSTRLIASDHLASELGFELTGNPGKGENKYIHKEIQKYFAYEDYNLDKVKKEMKNGLYREKPLKFFKNHAFFKYNPKIHEYELFSVSDFIQYMDQNKEIRKEILGLYENEN